MIRSIAHCMSQLCIAVGHRHITYTCRYALRLITSLEYSQYLENYLWPHFSKERVQSLALSDAIHTMTAVIIHVCAVQ